MDKSVPGAGISHSPALSRGLDPRVTLNPARATRDPRIKSAGSDCGWESEGGTRRLVKRRALGSSPRVTAGGWDEFAPPAAPGEKRWGGPEALVEGLLAAGNAGDFLFNHALDDGGQVFVQPFLEHGAQHVAHQRLERGAGIAEA